LALYFFALLGYWLNYVNVFGFVALTAYLALYFGLFGFYAVHFLNPEILSEKMFIRRHVASIFLSLPCGWYWSMCAVG